MFTRRPIRVLGGAARSIRCYAGVGYDGAAGCARAAERWAARGFTGVKAKIGYPTVQEDVAVIRAIRKAAGADMHIMVDYNQSLTPAEAIERTMGGIADASRAKILGLNAARFFGFDVPAAKRAAADPR